MIVNISPTNDVFIDANSPTTNFEGLDNIDVGEANGGSEKRRVLTKFDLNSQVPANARVISSSLKFTDRGTDLSANTRTMRVYRVLTPYVASEVTWNKRNSSTNWTSSGASDTSSDRESTEIGSVSMPATEVAGEVSITLDSSKIQELVNGTVTNNGFIVIMDTESNDMHRFNSSEWSTPSERPILTVEYALDGGILTRLI